MYNQRLRTSFQDNLNDSQIPSAYLSFFFGTRQGVLGRVVLGIVKLGRLFYKRF